MGRCFASCCNSTCCTQTTRFTILVFRNLWKEVYASALGRPLDIIHKRVVRLSVSTSYKTNLVFETFHVSSGFSLHVFGANLLDAHVLDTHIEDSLICLVSCYPALPGDSQATSQGDFWGAVFLSKKKHLLGQQLIPKFHLWRGAPICPRRRAGRPRGAPSAGEPPWGPGENQEMLLTAISVTKISVILPNTVTKSKTFHASLK